jgi:hypothetical protein
MRGPVVGGDLHIAHDLVEMARMDQRPDLGRGIERMADFDAADTLGEAFDEAIVDPRLQQQSRR